MGAFLQKHLDEIFILAGCALLLVGTYQVNPLYVWFEAGAMCIIVGVIVGVGQKTGGKP
jgi:hypothetical protein